MIDTDGNKALTIKNSYISREFVVNRKRLSTVSLQNQLTGRTLTPAENSEEFSLSFATFPKRVVDCSELRVDDIRAFENDGLSTAEFVFKPIKIKGCPITVTLSVALRDTDSYMRRFITLETESNESDLKLDYIGFDGFVFDPLIKSWQIPAQEDCTIPGFEMELGQPIYVDTMFFGCEFPCALNRIYDNRVCLRYYSGRKVTELCTDNRYVSWAAVCGSASDTDEEVIKHDFLEYIRSISLPQTFRKQYNSWYDHMYDINDENISRSFCEIEKGCTRFGLAPLDAYVADDGWNDYDGSFWGFNRKFPNELYPAKKLTNNLCSSFGLWLGPRGGYGKDTPAFAKRIGTSGNGHYCRRTRDICVLSSTYLEKLEKLLLDYTTRFDLSYWKLDGFARRPCKDSTHGHITGGKDNMYFYTELCERWLRIFNSLRELRRSQGKELWLNITCYVNPSPWLLQWVNSVWIQNSNDIGFTDTSDNGTKLGGNDKDKVLTYRDDKYYDFYKIRQLQFPQACLYNHDPIYGITAKIKMSSSDFLEMLMMNACRGTGFWELYYSYTMMDDEKWAYSAAVLDWAEKNRSILSTSHLIGNPPISGGVYGYSCWKSSNGIVALRNPSSGNVSFTLYFDEKLGMLKGSEPVSCCDVITGAIYGDVPYCGSMDVQLQPHELKIFSFGSEVQPFSVPKVPEKATELAPGTPISGKGAFTVRAFVSPDDSGILYSQGDELSLGVNEEGLLVFKLRDLTAVSETDITKAAQLAAVREPNGMIKLYIDGNLEASAYNGEANALSGHEVSSTVKYAVFNGALAFDEVLS